MRVSPIIGVSALMVIGLMVLAANRVQAQVGVVGATGSGAVSSVTESEGAQEVITAVKSDFLGKGSIVEVVAPIVPPVLETVVTTSIAPLEGGGAAPQGNPSASTVVLVIGSPLSANTSVAANSSATRTLDPALGLAAPVQMPDANATSISSPLQLSTSAPEVITSAPPTSIAPPAWVIDANTVVEGMSTAHQQNVIQQQNKDLQALSKQVQLFEHAVAEANLAVAPSVVASTTNGASNVPEALKVVQSLGELRSRGGLDLYADSDHDGISDYDEVNFYGTDPRNAYTAGDALSDGQRVLRGLDPRSRSVSPVSVESPTDAGTVTQHLFAVTEISVVAAATNAPTTGAMGAAMTADSTMGSGTTTPPAVPAEKVLNFEGKALPNSFVTLYIFSTPVVVTVKTDENGNWKYTLDRELPDGNHNLYVAMVNNNGRIIAKSPAVPFVQRAEAVEFVPLSIPQVTEPTFIDTVRENLLVAGSAVLLMFGALAILVLGLRRIETDTPPLAS